MTKVAKENMNKNELSVVVYYSETYLSFRSAVAY